MNKKEFNVFFIESPARNTAPFRIATIARYENGSRLVSEAKWDADAISPQASALIRLVHTLLEQVREGTALDTADTKRDTSGASDGV